MPISESADLVFYYAPRSRAFRVLWFLEELDRPYKVHLISLEKAEHKQAEFLKVSPMGKVPAVVDQGTPIAESGAILAYLGDKYSAGHLAPRPDDPRRADYLHWLFFAAGVMEGAFGEKLFNWDVPARRVAWGSFADMEKAITAALAPGSWLLGEEFTAADVFICSNLHWGMLMKLFPDNRVIAGYVERCATRPALERALEIEERFINDGR